MVESTPQQEGNGYDLGVCTILNVFFIGEDLSHLRTLFRRSTVLALSINFIEQYLHNNNSGIYNRLYLRTVVLVNQVTTQLIGKNNLTVTECTVRTHTCMCVYVLKPTTRCKPTIFFFRTEWSAYVVRRTHALFFGHETGKNTEKLGRSSSCTRSRNKIHF